MEFGFDFIARCMAAEALENGGSISLTAGNGIKIEVDSETGSTTISLNGITITTVEGTTTITFAAVDESEEDDVSFTLSDLASLKRLVNSIPLTVVKTEEEATEENVAYLIDPDLEEEVNE